MGIRVSSSVLEILELANGEVILKQADQEGEPLVSIVFSEDSRGLIGDACLEVAKAMIKAGIEEAAAIADEKGIAKAQIIESVEHTVH
jgi:hypothetical protein